LESVIAGVIGIIGVVLGFLLNVMYERTRRAWLRFGDLHPYSFEQSIRILLEVKYDKGGLPANRAVPFLTIKYGGKEGIPSQLLVIKNNSEYVCVNSCFQGPKSVDYLVPIKCVFRDGAWKPNTEMVIVRSEALPWTLPVYIGKGKEGYEYKHVTHIPVGGSGKVVLFDIYKYEYGSKNYLLKVHSEYGTDVLPRVLLKLPVEQENSEDKLEFEITVCAENLRGSTTAKVVVKYLKTEKDYLLKYYADKNLIKILKFKELSKDIRELKPSAR